MGRLILPFTVAALTGAALGGCGGPDEDSLVYPETRRADHVDEYHGEKVADPYRWMEDLDSEALAAWVRAQNELAQPRLEAIPAREAIVARLKTLWDYERYGVPEKVGGRYFYERNDGLQDQDVLYMTESLEAEPAVVIDPNAFSEDATIALARYSISHDGNKIAYAISDGGSDWTTWRVKDIDAGELLEDEIGDTKFTSVSWSLDNEGFYYSRYPRNEQGEPDDQQQVAIYYHRLGEPQSEDVLIYEITDHPTRNPYGQVTLDGEYLLIFVFDGFDVNGVYYLPLGKPLGEPREGTLDAALPAEDAEVVRLLDDWDAWYEPVGTRGSTFYVRTTRDAPRGRVVAIDLDDPAPENWRVPVPESAAVLEEASFVAGQFFAQYLEDAKSRVERYAENGEFLGTLELPGLGTADGFTGRPDDTETFYAFSSFTSPSSIFRFDVEEETSSLFRRAEVDIDPEAYVTKQVFYSSKDGTLVPMFIVHRKGLELDGDNPTLLYGYGGFNVSLTPSYSTTRMVWLEMGGVLAIPNLRGGGEYGESWHEAGTKTRKQNVFDDFIAAAEWLVEQGYTSSDKLAISGRSNGGLLVGAALTQRPDLFGAALPAVGVLDMLRYHTASANAEAWSSDYGLSRNEDEYRALRAYSPYHNLEQGRCYPPTLVTTADRDDRVVPWHSFKFAAALQHAQGCPNPVLIRVETRAGHGAGKPTWMVIEDYADQWAFLVEHLDMETPSFATARAD